MSNNDDKIIKVTIEVNGVAVSFEADTERCKDPSALANRIAEYALQIGDAIKFGKEARDWKKLEEGYRNPLKEFMVENGVVSIAGPDGQAKLCASNSNQPNRDLARKILTPEQYRAIFEDKRPIEVLKFYAAS